MMSVCINPLEIHGFTKYFKNLIQITEIIINRIWAERVFYRSESDDIYTVCT